MVVAGPSAAVPSATTATELTGGVTDNIKADGQANGIVKPNDL
jgi:hypothetical protein